METERILLIGGVALVKGKVQDAGVIMVEICYELEPMLRKVEFTERAPFYTISLIIRFGDQNSLEPEYQRISRKYDELPVAIEVDMARIRRQPKEILKPIFGRATMIVLRNVALKYNLPSEFLDEADKLYE